MLPAVWVRVVRSVRHPAAGRAGSSAARRAVALVRAALTAAMALALALALAVGTGTGRAGAAPAPAPAPSATGVPGMPVAVAVAGAGAGEPIGPHQHFEGLVNGRRRAATIKVVCPGPAGPGRTGPPAGDQVVAVHHVRAGTAGAGDTGSAGDSIVATVGGAPTTVMAGTFTTYGGLTLPSQLRLPCAGNGVVLFSPSPGSPVASDVSVDVAFDNIAL